MATFYTLKSFNGKNNNSVKLFAIKSRKQQMLGFEVEYTQDNIGYTELRTKDAKTAAACYADTVAAIKEGWAI